MPNHFEDDLRVARCAQVAIAIVQERNLDSAINLGAWEIVTASWQTAKGKEAALTEFQRHRFEQALETLEQESDAMASASLYTVHSAGLFLKAELQVAEVENYFQTIVESYAAQRISRDRGGSSLSGEELAASVWLQNEFKWRETFKSQLSATTRNAAYRWVRNAAWYQAADQLELYFDYLDMIASH